MSALQVADFKAFCRSRETRELVTAALVSRAAAETIRAQVDAYIAPVFAQFTFTDDFEAHGRQSPTLGQRLTSPKDLYLSRDEAQCTAFYVACDEAHKAHGWTLPAGHCPALTAEHEQIKAEQALIAHAAPQFGIEPYQLYLEKRAEFLRLIIGAVLNGDH